MTVTRADRLEDATREHPDSAGAIAAWLAIVRAAQWKNRVDVRKTYPSADPVALPKNRTATVFNIRGNNYRLAVAINYPTGVVSVLRFMTHAEYRKDRWKASA